MEIVEKPKYNVLTTVLTLKPLSLRVLWVLVRTLFTLDATKSITTHLSNFHSPKLPLEVHQSYNHQPRLILLTI